MIFRSCYNNEQMGSNEEDTVPVVTINKPFSIRDYVLAVRKKDISSNWPFPDEYLQACMKHGISKVLPPFESHTSASNPSYGEETVSGCVKDEKATIVSSLANCIKTNEKEEHVEICNGLGIDKEISEVSKRVCILSLSVDRHEHGEESELNSDIPPMALKVCPSRTKPSSSMCHVDQGFVEMPSTKNLKYKRKKRRGKPKAKTRSIVDIFAEAKPCTLEELEKINDINRFVNQSLVPDHGDLGAVASEQFADEVNGSMSAADGEREAKSVGRFLKIKHSKDDIAENNVVSYIKRRIVRTRLKTENQISYNE